MTEETIETIDLHTEFEKLREQVIRDECCPDWKVAKTFEHTIIYKGTIDHSHHVVYKVSYYCQVYQLDTGGFVAGPPTGGGGGKLGQISLASKGGPHPYIACMDSVT